MFKRLVNGVEALALVAVAVVIVLLFAYRPSPPAAVSPTAVDVADDPVAAGEAIFRANCARCHGSKGQGASAPKLADGAVVPRFPNPADEAAVVSNGRGTMPAWSSRLTAAQIDAVVRYTREGL